MVCSAASASSRAGLAASSFSSATTLSAYSVNMTQCCDTSATYTLYNTGACLLTLLSTNKEHVQRTNTHNHLLPIFKHYFFVGLVAKVTGIKIETIIIMATAYAERATCYRPSVRLSVCLSHGWIQKRLKLGSCNFHRTVAPSLCFLRYKFHPEIPMGSPRAGASNNGGLWETSYFRSSNAFARWLPKLDILSQLLQSYSPGGGTVAR